MKGLLAFCPTHDFAMPYLAAPLIKGFVEQSDPSIGIKCIDLNLEFFASAIPDYQQLLKRYREEVNGRGVSVAVRAALSAQREALHAVQNLTERYPGHLWSLRNYRSPHDRQDFSCCVEYANNPSPFDDIYNSFLNREVTPDFLAASVTVEDQLQPTLRLLAMARKTWRSIPFILGGNLLNRICRFMEPERLAQFCDYLLLREGERPFLELLQRLAVGGHPSDPRIVDVRKDRLPTLAHLDTLPLELHTSLVPDFHPCFDDLPVSDYFAPRQIVPVLTSRRCYWARCNFCTIHSAWDPSHRERAPDNVVEEMLRHVTTDGTKHFRIVDESCPPKLLGGVAKILNQTRSDLIFEIYGILEKRFSDSSFVQQIATAGCRQIFFGLESRDPATLGAMGKHINLTEDIDRTLATTASYGIHNYVFTVFGYPGEDADAQERTIQYIINDRNVHTAVVSNFVAELESRFSKEGGRKLVHDGRMTEKFATMELDGRMVCARTNGAAAAIRAQREIYERRQDIALTALLNDEARLVLAARFGPDFAQQALLDDPNIAELLGAVFKVAADERIRRQVT